MLIRKEMEEEEAGEPVEEDDYEERASGRRRRNMILSEAFGTPSQRSKLFGTAAAPDKSS